MLTNTRFQLVVLVLLLLQVVYLAFADLDTRPFSRKSEARTAVAAREMIANQDMLIPRVNDELRLQKPPLYYWLIVAADNGDGQISHRESRLPAVVSGVLLALLLGIFVYARYKPVLADHAIPMALLAGTMLLTTPGFFVKMRHAEAESLLALAVVSVVVLLHWNGRNPGGIRLLAAFAVSGIGFLVKGPMLLALAWPGYVIARGRELSQQWRWVIIGLVVMLLLASSWFIAAAVRVGGIDTFLNEVAVRFQGDAPHQRPIYFYLTELFSTAMPWSLILPVALLSAWQRRQDKTTAQLFWTFIAGFVLITALKTKQVHYLMPLYPLMVLLIMDYLQHGLVSGQRWLQRSSHGLLLIYLPLLLLLLSLSTVFVIEQMVPVAVVSIAWCLLGVIILYRYQHITRLFWLPAWSAGCMLAVLLFAVQYLSPVTRLKEDHAAFLGSLDRQLASQQLAMNFFDERVVYYLQGKVPVFQALPDKPVSGYPYVLSKGPGNPDPALYRFHSRDAGFVSDSIYLWDSVQESVGREQLGMILGTNAAFSVSQTDSFADAAVTAYVHRAGTVLAVNVIMQSDVSLAQFVSGLQRLADSVARQQAGWKVLVLDYASPSGGLRGRWRALYQTRVLEEFLQKTTFDLVIDNSQPGIVTDDMASRVIRRSEKTFCNLDLDRTGEVLIVNLTDCDKRPAGAYVFRRTINSNGVSLVSK
jgi:4-amino-4-deoxy-L-arabinose transferase-like glycosyltransferase